jgi:hypothetical protein
LKRVVYYINNFYEEFIINQHLAGIGYQVADFLKANADIPFVDFPY